ncbi:MAG TPA: hypothetical protein VKB68_09505 [Stellaceae bacterium]|nr:hypothetical protein [Stellaceae bacterium]
MALSVTRALQAFKRYAVSPEQIDYAMLSAINVTLFLTSGGDDRVSDGFNRDLAGNSRDFGRWVKEPAPISPELASAQSKLS